MFSLCRDWSFILCFSWPISKELLLEVLSDRVSDRFVCELVWERLGYQVSKIGIEDWYAGEATPEYWSNHYQEAPQLIADRKASVRLTRSIPIQYKQSLKQHLNFAGYRIGELYPRRTRRATVVNWLLFWLFDRGESLQQKGPIPNLLKPPFNPVYGHPGDISVY